MTNRKKGERTARFSLRATALVTLAVMLFVLVTAFAEPPKMYDLEIIDGDLDLAISTSSENVEEILKNTGIKVNEKYGDSIDVSAFTHENGSRIVINRGVKVTVSLSDGSVETVYSSGSVKRALAAAGVKLEKGFALNYGESDPLEDGMIIKVMKLNRVKLTVDGKTYSKFVAAKTVADVLKVFGVELGEEDYCKPALDAKIKNGSKIKVFRVETKECSEEETIEYSTDYSKTDTLEKGATKIVKTGSEGVKSLIYSEKYVDGELTERELVSEKIIKQPTNAEILVGTKEKTKPFIPADVNVPADYCISKLPVPSSVKIGSNGIPINYQSAIRATATAYYEPGGTTSTGKPARTGYIAVDPNEIPYGTEMYIVSDDGRYVYGYCIAADTGGFIKTVDWTVDLYMDSEEECIQWGRRGIIIYFL